MSMTRLKFDHANVGYVLDNLRPADKAELMAQVHGNAPTPVLADLMDDYTLKFCFGRDNPIACVGATEIHPRVWQAWMFATPEFNSIALATTRFVKKWLIPAIEGLNAHRCQALAAKQNTDACRWLEILGAKKEAILLRYGRDGEDFVMYRWDNRRHVPI